MSKLNPYAAEYVPLFKRQVDNQTHPIEKGVRHGGEAVGFGNSHHTSHEQHNSHSHAPDKHLSSDPFSLTNSSSLHSTNQDPSKHIVDEEESEIDLDYLQGRFPSLSYQSIIDAYLFNSGDVEATVDMVVDLENGTESSEILPETLDIGDVPEPEPWADSTSLKLKNVTTEASSSSM